jgi:hypothetical protein
MDLYQMGLGLFGQNAEQAAKRDMDDYDPSTGTVERQGLEKLGDMLRGGGAAVNEAAQKQHIKGLKKSQAAANIETLTGKAPTIAFDTTLSGLRGTSRKETLKDQAKQRGAIRDEVYKSQGEKDKRDAVELERLRIAGREKESDRRYYEDRINARETKLMELDLKKQGQRNEMAMFDKRLAADARSNKRERMMALMAGLANLGGAFTI